MWQKFKTEKPEFYVPIMSSLEKNKSLSHTYLIESNNYGNILELLHSFGAFLLSYDMEKSEDEEKVQYDLIKNNANPDYFFITADGQYIKKEQLEELKEKLMTKSITNKRRVYVIYEAEKLNVSAANSMLKFLEEPEEGIIAILVTNNIYQVLPTIRSRCQVYHLNSDDSLYEWSNLEELVDFIELLEDNGKDSIAFVDKYINVLFANNDIASKTLKDMEQIYFIALNNEYSKLPTDKLSDKLQKIKFADIIKKIEIITKYLDVRGFNINMKLWIDAFILEFGGN